MSFISNASHFTLGEGVYNNIHNMTVHNTLRIKRKRHRGEIEGRAQTWPDASALLSLIEPTRKRRRREEVDGIRVIRDKHLKLTLEIGSGPGYFLHTGEIKGRAVIVQVFNDRPTVREQLETTVAVSKRLMHPNVLRLKGISSPVSFKHFIAYENAYWKTADGPLAAALKKDLMKSVTLGFKMVAGLSSGINHLSTQGIPLTSLGVENFDVFVDIGDRFLISINPKLSSDPEGGEDPKRHDDAKRSWDIFNALCQKVLRSANRALHSEDIERYPTLIHPSPRPSVAPGSITPSSPVSLPSSESVPLPQNIPEEGLPVPPRREYVWRALDRGQQSLATVARRIDMDLELKLSSVNKFACTDEESAHRCAGYVREEITLATTTGDSAVVSHDAPSPLEVCTVCHEVVGYPRFQCICGDPNPGSRPTVKCQACKLWRHRDCVGGPRDFGCQLCELLAEFISLMSSGDKSKEHELERKLGDIMKISGMTHAEMYKKLQAIQVAVEQPDSLRNANANNPSPLVSRCTHNQKHSSPQLQMSGSPVSLPTPTPTSAVHWQSPL
ncbi:hypothetical protein C8R44DRAFT_824576 [Mycena epipterygia]|nr:hypothetical protein C8R44DRAFT_824576 [Mycena epipterygia]